MEKRLLILRSEYIYIYIYIYINKIENRIMFNIKTGYYLQPLAPQTIKLLGDTKIKRTKN